MPRARPAYTALNGGEFGLELMSQIDFERYRLAGERVENWIPMITGGLQKATGLRVIKEVTGDAHLRSVESTRDLGYLSLFQAGSTSFVYDDVVVQTGSPVTITNGTFASGTPPTGWTDSSTGSATIAGGGSGMTMTVPVASTGAARADQEFTGATIDARHNVKVTVTSGPVTVEFGSAQGTSDYASGTIDAGEHVFEITPSATTFWCRISSTNKTPRVVESIASVSASDLSITNTYTAAALTSIRASQLNDTVFLADGTGQLSSLARRGESAFGFGVEQLLNGPFETINSTSTSITPSGVEGSITITSTEPIFEPSSVGQTIEITHPGQTKALSITTENTFTDEVEISGSGTFRNISVVATGVSGNTVTLQRSFGTTGNFKDFQNYTTNQNITVDDNLDGQTVFYRIGIKTGNYTSGTVDVSLSTASGSTTGEAKITAFTSSTNVTASVLSAIGDTTATSLFAKSIFGGDTHPIEVEFQEGRLWVASTVQLFGSQSDDFTNFATGSLDSDAIDRRSGSRIQWLQSMGDLGVGENKDITVASSGEFSTPYTPTNFRLRPDINRGSASVEAVAVDSVGIYVDRDGESLMEVIVDDAQGKAVSTPLTRLHPRICIGGISRIQLQVAPEPRIWAMKSSSELVGMTYARAENVVGWFRRPVNGRVKDIAVVRGSRRDRIYVLVEREISGASRTFLCVMDNEVWTEGAEANHLDFSHTPIKPSSPSGIVTPSATTGTITVSSDRDVFASGDVGKKLFLSEGIATIASFVDAKSVTAIVSTDLRNTKSVASGFWFMGAASTVVTGLVGLESQSVSAWIDGVQYDDISVDSSGNATLPVAGAWTHVGKVMPPAVYQSMKLYQGGTKGAAVDGTTKRIDEIGIALLRTGPGLKVGARSVELSESVSDSRKFINGAIFTGEHRETVEGEHEFDPRAYIVSDNASTATVLGYAPGFKANVR